MTRETKLGIGVSGALLVLVGLAVVRAWVGAEATEGPEPAAEVAVTTPEPPTPAEPVSNAENGQRNARAASTGDPPVEAPGLVPAVALEAAPLPKNDGPPPRALPSGPQSPAQPTAPPSTPNIDVPKAELPAPPGSDASRTAGPHPGKAAPALSEGTAPGTLVNIVGPSAPKESKAAPAPKSAKEKSVPVQASSKSTELTTEELLKLQQRAQADADKQPGPDHMALPLPPSASLPAPPASKEVSTEPSAKQPPATADAALPGPGPSSVPAAAPPLPVQVKIEPKGADGQGGTVIPQASGKPPTASSDKPGQTPVAASPPGAPVQAPAVAMEGPRKDPGTASDAAPAVRAPTIQIGDAGRAPPAVGGATVHDFDVQTFRCTPGVQTLQAISLKFYQDAKYARALYRFNQGMPDAEAIRDEVSPLPVGQPVRVPSVSKLQERYGADIREERPAAAGQPVAVTPPANVGRPGPDGTRTYQVRDNGQMLFEIARETLGDGRRWWEIYRLNPDIQPEQPIRGGTVLRLPATARTGS